MKARNLSLLFRAMWVVLAVVLTPGWGEPRVENTVHNLSARAGGKGGVASDSCNFCHIPHNARPTRALWNRPLSGTTYKTYSSSTLDAAISQPTGSSRLCLSCHDGTIAMENLRVKPKGEAFSFGNLKGKNSLGTDLSDDHPISFSYNAELVARNDELADPASLPHLIRLDASSQLQCTSCHDPHEDRNPKFLLTDNRLSGLCTGCHRIRGWSSSIHATSAASLIDSGSSPKADFNFETVAENGCSNCHRVHTAGRPQWLLKFADQERNCLDCHTGSNAATDVGREFKKRSAHPMEGTKGIHRPGENPGLMERHTTCTDCHNPHAAQSGGNSPAALPPALKGVSGINSSGSAVPVASAEYEVCYRCHGLQEQSRAMLTRQDNTTNARAEFDPGNRSFHPVEAPSRQPDLPGLLMANTVSGRIRCGSCHRSDNDGAARGPHGSAFEPILAREYKTEGPLPDSFQAYALCYQCHDRMTLFAEQNGFPHRIHVAQVRATCATCHDAHGSRMNAHLINFMIRGRQGNTIVSPSRSGRLEFQDLGKGQGSCYLSCHGSDHDARSYPVKPVKKLSRNLILD